MEESKLDKVIAQCEWAIRQPSPTIIEAKKFYEGTLEVLKSQQAEIERLEAKQQPMIAKGINGTFGSGIGYCPSCGNGMHYANYPGQLTQHYCDQCGQAVKWSD